MKYQTFESSHNMVMLGQQANDSNSLMGIFKLIFTRVNLQRRRKYCLTVMVERTVLIEPWGSTLLTDLREVSTVCHPSRPN